MVATTQPSPAAHRAHPTSARPPLRKLGAVALALVAGLAACGDEAAPDGDHGHDHAHGDLVTTLAPLWVNGNFETGTNNNPPPDWTITAYTNNGLTTTTPTKFSDLGLAAGSTYRTKTWLAAEGSQADSYLGTNASLRWPRYGGGVAVLDVQTGAVANSMKQTMTLGVGDIDPVDGKVHIRFAIAPVLENPNHSAAQQPYFFVELRNITKNIQLYQDFNWANQPGIPWKNNGASTTYLYTDWQLVDIAPTSVQAQIGDQIELVVVAAGCSPTGHWARVYVDGVGPTVPSLFVSADGPDSANAGDNITYDMDYHNGGTGAAGSTVVKINLPANTTFVSVSGATCTTPAVGGTGLVTCNIGTVNPGQSGTFKVTVKINSGATGTITLGNYTIESLTVQPLIGPKVLTTITANVTYADLDITKTDGVGGVAWNTNTTYTIVAKNLGPSAVTGARVTDTMPAQLTNVTWTCAAAGGGACGTASGTGNINHLVNLPVGATATFTVSAKIITGTGTSSVTNAATIAVPTGVTDSYLDNNGAADTDSIGELRTVTVTKLGIGQGNLVSVPAAISCDSTCTTDQGSFVQGQQIVLSVNPLPGHTFEGWGGDCAFAGTSNCTITVNSNLNVTATISKPLVGDGTPCSLAAECQSGNCVDGVCCNTGCGGGAADCYACNVTGKVGTCSLRNLTGITDGPLCDGDDDDCDGLFDENYQSSQTSCGVGECRRIGQTTCSGGTVGDTCSPGQPTAEVCDGKDNDCDGLTDAADPNLVLVACDKNTGVCAGLMKTASMCVSGAWQACPDSYYASNRFPNYALTDTCEGRDNDCDGTTDEDHAVTATSCGTGACASTGQLTCTAGVVTNTCKAGTAAANDATCNGVDNDCNGQTDEDYIISATSCGTGACARSGSNYCVLGVVINSCVAGTPAANDAVCNNVDDDCSGQTDEDYVQANTSCGTGVCARTGKTTCTAGVVGDTCVAGQPEASEICDAKDNDCDGLTDAADATLALPKCEKQAGVCAGLNKAPSLCVSGAWQACSDAYYASQRFPDYALTDACDGLDNDCDGTSEENFASVNTACGVGACASTGRTVCTAGSVEDTCETSAPGASEVCDGVDNDCDGLTDAADPGLVTIACEKQSGVCQGVMKAPSLCVSGAWKPCTDAYYSAERFGLYDLVDACDGKDNDCDAQTDEGHVATATSCGTGACARTGQRQCVSGAVVDSCSAGAPAANDSNCNGVDDNCNGSTDETYVAPATSCGVGACVRAGFGYCVQGKVVDSCVAGTPAASDATCNNVDEDCSGSADEDFVGVDTSCGRGVCARTGKTTCTGGVVGDSCQAGPPEASETCDGKDNDCDGATDGADATLSLVDCEKQAGVCQGTKKTAALCVSGAWQACTDSVYSAQRFPDYSVNDTCDGKDSDCDGVVDGDFAASPTSCGVGVCARTGQTTCEAGVIGDSCEAGDPAAAEVCDGKDNDCDGLVDGADPGLVLVDCEKQAGVCAGTKKPAALCVGGAWQACTDSVYSAQRFPDYSVNDTCDGKDSDCDGLTDGDFVATPTGCGVGVCVRTGQTTCVSGVVGDSCKAGEPEASEVCDGKDNDCDGATDGADAGLVTVACEKQAGVCQGLQKSASLCVAGAWQACTDAYYAVQRFPDYKLEDVCDGVDSDCDGQADEDFQGKPTACGTGACASTGTTTCTGGVVGDSCAPGTPSADELCDGKDNDCDGKTDAGDDDLVAVPCEKQAGVCQGLDKAPSLCVNGAWQACTDAYYTAQRFPDYELEDVCDGVDSDCDGERDEDFASKSTACGVGVCARTGVTTCESGVTGDTCKAGEPEAAEVCDGKDNDCDGTTDAADAGLVTVACEKQDGVCAGTKKPAALCVGGAWQDCTDATYSAQRFPDYGVNDTCDGKDSDCDGVVDGDFIATPTACGVGVCVRAGVTTCEGGVVGDSCEAGEPEASEVCDGKDNDCDGAIDSADAGLVTVACEKQDGVCAGTKKPAALCVGGAWQGCTDATYTAQRFPDYNIDDTCDGKDSDCDGATDGDYVPTSTACGIGACARTGERQCQDGVVRDTCTAGQPAGDDPTCDASDDDCDGFTDEEYIPTVTACGTGACARNGLSFCVQGAQIDSCIAGEPGATDKSCNAVDDDCDGTTDEEFPKDQLCMVGVGACERSGVFVCEAGATVCGATAGTPTNERCDAVDNDCNGETDDGAVGGTVCNQLDTQLAEVPPAITAMREAMFTFSDPIDPSNTAFECSLDGGAWVRCDGGAVSYVDLLDGPHTFLVRSVGPDGSVDATPAFHAWQVDQTMPDTIIALAPSDPAQSTTAAFAFEATVDEVGSYWCALDPGSKPPLAADYGRCDALTTYEGLSEGPHSLWVYVVAASGVADTTPAEHHWVVDLSAPETAIATGPTETTGETTATFTYASPSDPSLETFRCRFDGGDWKPCDGGTTSFEGLEDGEYTFEVATVDEGGIVDPTPASWTWVVDTTPPDTFIPVKPTDPSQTSEATFAFSSNELGVSYRCALDVQAAPAPGSPLWQDCAAVTTLRDLDDGPHTLYVVAVDETGHVDPTPASYTWVVDTSAPDTTITAQPPVQTGPSDGASFEFTSPDSEGDVYYECRLDQGNWARCDEGALEVDAAGLPLGEHTFQVRACTEASGLCDPTPAVASWTVTTSNCPLDVVAPAVTCGAGATLECSGEGHASTELVGPVGSDPCGVMDITGEVPTRFELGTTPVVFAMQDGNKNRATCVTEVKVVDTTPPVITCGEAIAVTTDPGTCGAVIEPAAPSASDVCFGEVVVYNDAPAIFPVGMSTLTWTALDAAGHTTSCEVAVTVVDDEPLTLTCAEARIEEAPPTACGWTGAIEASARDNCAVEVTTLVQENTYPVGKTDVLFDANDASGNEASCVTALEVRDVTAPVVTCPVVPADADGVLGTYRGEANDACSATVRVDGVVCESLDAEGNVTGTVEASACPVAIVDGALEVTGRLAAPALRVSFQVVADDPSGNTGSADCSLTFAPDRDNDGVVNERDNCPDVANAEQLDGDGDGVGDRCDVCPTVDDDQADVDGNGIGDACQDTDADGVLDTVDVCPGIGDDQLDSDGDGDGDACDPTPFEGYGAQGGGGCSGGAGTSGVVALLGLVGLALMRRRARVAR